MHQPISEQESWLRQVVTGFFAYHGVRPTVGHCRRSALRRGQRDRMTRTRITKLPDDLLPKPRILHPSPRDRFAVTHLRSEPCTRVGPRTALCSGGTQY